MDAIARLEPAATLRGYMDDLTATCAPGIAYRVAQSVAVSLREFGFEANVDKSKILYCSGATGLLAAACATDAAAAAPAAETTTTSTGITVCDEQAMFKVLGGNITGSDAAYREYNAEQSARHASFFNMLRKVPLHSQIAFTIARLCGSPRCKFYASVTPPDRSREILANFQQSMVSYVQDLLCFDIPVPALHDRFGAGLPNYVDNAVALYDSSSGYALHGRALIDVALVTSVSIEFGAEWTAHFRSQSEAAWMFYVPIGAANHMSSQQFNTAMAIRCHSCPRALGNRIGHLTCSCGLTSVNQNDIVQHALSCEYTRFTPTQRHTMVKYALARAVRDFGFYVAVEPRFYVYANATVQQRPDLTVFVGGSGIATDVVICKQDGPVGANAMHWAERKIRTHDAAVSAHGHQFIPFAMEVHGHRASCCYKFAEAVAAYVQPHLRWGLKRHIESLVSTTLAHARVEAVLASPQYAPRSYT
jgi:hypothetical protein